MEVEAIKRQLGSSTLKQRREAIKQLDVQLSSPLFLHQLDVATARLWPQDKIALATWPGLLDTFLGYLGREVLEHRKQPDSNALRVMRRIFSEADNPERCGPGRCHLLRRAGAAFDRFAKLLLEHAQPGEGLATPLGKEIVAALSKVLLPNPEYCQRASVGNFASLIEDVMLRFEALQDAIDRGRAAARDAQTAAAAAGRLATKASAAGAAASSVLAAESELFSLASLLSGLLSGVPGQLADAFAVDTAAFLVKALTWLDRQGRYGRLDSQLLACLNGLLLSYGADVRSIAPSTHRALAGYIKHAWGERHARVKESVVCFCRLSLALGGPQEVDRAQSELLQLVLRDMEAPGFAWDLQHSKQHQQLAALAASLFYHAAFPAAAAATAAGPQPSAAAAAGPASSSAAAASSLQQGSCDGSAGEPAAGSRVRRRKSSAAGSGGDADGMELDGAAAAEDEPDELLFLPRKRSRTLGPAGQLLGHLEAEPERWAPVVALLLHQHGQLLPPSFLAALQQQLTSSTVSLLASLAQSSSAAAGTAAAAAGGMHRPSASPAAGVPLTPGPGAAAAAGGSTSFAKAAQQQLLWLLRCGCELALCWPACLHPLAAAAADAPAPAGPNGAATGLAHAGYAFDAAGGCTSAAAWEHTAVAAAAAAAASGWQTVWDAALDLLAGAEQAALDSLVAPLGDALAWHLHALLALRLVRLPSKAAALMQAQRLLLPPAPAGDGEDGDGTAQAHGGGTALLLSDARLALLLSLCLGEAVSSQREAGLRQRLLAACLATAEACCSSGGRTALGVGAPAAPGAAAVAAAAASGAAGVVLPDLLFPAMLALLEAPGLPSPGLNGAPSEAEAAASVAGVPGLGAGAPLSPAAAAALGAPALSGGLVGLGASAGSSCVVWYHASSWWWSDRRVEAGVEGLETPLEHLQRQLAAVQLQQLLAGAAPAPVDAAAAAGLPGPGTTPGHPAAQAGSADGGADTGSARASTWWRNWTQLADAAAEQLSDALQHFMLDEREEDQDQDQEQLLLRGGAYYDASAAAAHPPDPLKQLNHMLLLLNAALSLPCIAAIKCLQHGVACKPPQPQQQEGQQQQQQQQPQLWCGVAFSPLSGRHVQLQRSVMRVGIQAGKLLAEHLHQLPCVPGATWLQQLLHLGSSLARVQALLGPTQLAALPDGERPGLSWVEYARLAAAAVLGEVVKTLEARLSEAAAAAVAPLDDTGRARPSAAGDLDLDDDFPEAAGQPLARPSAALGTQQHGPPGAPGGAATQAAFVSTQAGALAPPGSRGAAAAAAVAAAAAAGGTGAAGGAASPGFVFFLGGGLAGFSGRAASGLGPSSRPVAPVLLPPDTCSSPARPPWPWPAGYASGGLGEGLAGLAGIEGAGLRVFAALAPAYADTAQAVLRLWKHVAGLSGGAPSDALLQAAVETTCSAVCAGGWTHLGQLFGLIRGSHTLLAAQKVPLSTLHLLLRLLQQVASAAPAAGLRLDAPCAVFQADASQAAGGSQQDAGDEARTYLGAMLTIFRDVCGRLSKLRAQGGTEHQPLPLATQLQLGLTALALLRLLPTHAYGSADDASVLAAAAVLGAADGAAAGGADASDVDSWRGSVLELLESPSLALRMRAGPLAAQLVAAAAIAAAERASHAGGGSGAGGSVAASLATALADLEPHLQLQLGATLSPSQQERVAARQAVLSQASAGDADAQARERAAVRSAQQEAACWETAVVQLVFLSLAAPTAAAAGLACQQPPDSLEARLLLLLCRHTASLQLLPAEALPGAAASQGGGAVADGGACRAAALRLAAAALDVMAAQQQYGCCFSFLAYHGRTWLRDWVAAGEGVQPLLLLTSVVCPQPAATGGGGADDGSLTWHGGAVELPPLAPTPAAATQAGTQAQPPPGAVHALLACYGTSLVFWLIFYDARGELDALAAAAGVSVAQLVGRCKYELCGGIFPLLQAPGQRQRMARFNTAMGNPNTAEMSPRHTLALVASLLLYTLPRRDAGAGAGANGDAAPQQQEQDEALAELRLPFYSLGSAQKGCAVLAASLSRSASSWLMALSLPPASVQALLLELHRNMVAAAYPLHRLQRLGQFEALLAQLAPAELCAPAIARHLAAVLLQQLQTPALQAACCSCLRALFRQLYTAAEAAAAAAAEDRAAAAASKGKAADKRHAQQRLQSYEQLAATVLGELLPPTVAALVQAAEASAAAAQLGLQQQLWAASPGGPAARVVAAAAAGRRQLSVVDLPPAYPPAALLSFLLCKPPDSLTAVLQTLDLLPPLPVLAGALARQQQLRQGLGPAQGLVLFAARAAGMAASSRRRAVHTVLQQLSNSGVREGFFVQQQQQHPGAAGDAAAAARPKVQPAVLAAAFQLAQLGAQLADAAVIELAGQLLALAGPLDADVITFDAEPPAAGTGSSSSSSGSSSGGGGSERTAFPMVAMLQHLTECLFEARPRVVGVAQATLAQLLAKPEAAATLQAVQSGKGSGRDLPASATLLLVASLSVYAASVPRDGAGSDSQQLPVAKLQLGSDVATAALQVAASRELWCPVGRPFEAWLCSLCSTLLRACGAVEAAAPGAPPGALLQLLADAAALRPALAELLLPHALLQLCMSDGSGADLPGVGSHGWAARLGEAIASGLRLGNQQQPPPQPQQQQPGGGAAGCTPAGVDVRCLGVLLACLEHARAVHLAALMALPARSPHPAVSWQRCYCLHLDYLAVAAAAMAVRAYFTALIYIEHYTEERYGRLTLNPHPADACGTPALLRLRQLAGLHGAGDASGAGDAGSLGPAGREQQQQLEALLLELYANVNEPDGIYAVAAAFGSPASQLQLLKHEQQWAQVLGEEDAQLQVAAIQRQPGHGVSAVGVLGALQRLGCQAVAQQCLSATAAQLGRGAAAAAAPGGLALPPVPQELLQRRRQDQQQLLEAQCELTWRLSDWGLADRLLQPAQPVYRTSSGGALPGFSHLAAGGAPAAAGAAGALLAAADGGGGRPGSGSGGGGFQAAVLAALAALQSRDHEGFGASVSAAQAGCVLKLARCSTQSAAAVNPLLVQLQMLGMLAQGEALSRTAAAGGSSSSGGAGLQLADAAALLQQLLGPDFQASGVPAAAEQLACVSFELSDQLLALQGALTKALARPDALALTLQAHARTARRAGQAAFASAALQQLQALLQLAVGAARRGGAGAGAGAGAALAAAADSGGAALPRWLTAFVSPDAGWLLEEVKLKWLHGQQQPALHELQGLVAALQAQRAAGGSAGAGNAGGGEALLRALKLLASWTAAGTFSASYSDTMALLQQAAALAHEQQMAGASAAAAAQAAAGPAAAAAAASAARQARLACDLFFQLGQFADQHYRQLTAQAASPEWQKQQAVLAEKVRHIQEIDAAYAAWRALPPARQLAAKGQMEEIYRARGPTQRQVERDSLLVQQLAAGRAQALADALTGYRCAIAAGDAHDLQVVYRLTSLWFDHASDPSINQAMAQVFQQTPPAKFVPLVYQVASRLDTAPSDFQTTLVAALTSMACAHPYHTLYPIIALHNGGSGNSSGGGGGGALQVQRQADESKVQAATALLEQLRHVQGGKLRPIVDDMVTQVQLYISLSLEVHAKLPKEARGRQGGSVPMPAAYRRRLRDLQHAPPICLPLPLDPAGRYEDVPHVVEVDPSMQLVGGINSPLRIVTRDSAGCSLPQLAKSGNDDLRQDAVMQQFFGLVHTLLASSPASRQRRLGIRTYRVVPCSPRVGVLEWVEGTQPLTGILLGSMGSAGNHYAGGVYGRYRRQGDLSWMDCYSRLSANKDPGQALDAFNYCAAHFPPVLHHFFLEAFPHPAAWFGARTSYTRSSAAASMAGAVIGLGDRHLANILLDTATAEVVHIDLGVAFEQGLFLTTPERVPFRLTANLVDGFGAAGVEGPFRRCCETTMQVLRSHKEALLTVVAVVLHDPLYRWQMTPVTARRKQQDPLGPGGGDGSTAGASAAADTAGGAAGSGGTGTASDAAAGGGASGGSRGSGGEELGNADAERAVLRVKQKLEGQDVEGGVPLSVAAQVAALMQAARDPERLSRMFVGWAAWV